MNEDIKRMIELQRYWDNILRGKDDIERSEKSISRWEKQLEDKKNEISQVEKMVKDCKVVINQKEIELSERDEKAKKLEARKDFVKTSKEMTAVEHEFEKISEDKSALEDVLIELFDVSEEDESKLTVLNQGFTDLEKQTSKDIIDLKERIEHFSTLIVENQNNFDGIIDQLSASVKVRFLKLTKSQSGKAIAKIDGEICGACNCQIPFTLAQDMLKENIIVNCTNCGRFIYKS